MKQYLKIVVANCLVSAALLSRGNISPGEDQGLVGHWKLLSDCRDSSGNANHGINHGVRFSGSDGVTFDGIDGYIEVPDSKSLRPANGPFSVSVWVQTEKELDDVLGDILSKYDPDSRTGVTLSIMNYAGVTNAQSNWRNLSFGIDAGHIDPQWTDCGRPGNNHHIRSLTVYNGDLYASTWEPGKDETGHIYLYDGGQKWIDCGAPDNCNTMSALAVYKGKLYAGSELYSGGGSSLPESPNNNPGGKVFRYEGGKKWTDCGKVDEGVVSISGLAVFEGKLYAGTGTTGKYQPLPRTKGMYRYDGGTKWTSCGCPGHRIVHLGVYNGHLYGLSYDGGNVFRYEGGTQWTDLGVPPETTQVYAFMVYEGKMHVCTWPKALLCRYDGPGRWANLGQMGTEKESMAVSIYNGKIYVGTLPMAEVYRYDGDTRWTPTGRLDMTPDVRYRRAWSMAVYDGKLFCGTLPSGHVYSLEAGKCVTYDRELAPGWRHVAAVKASRRLELFIDGTQVARSSAFDPDKYNLSNQKPLLIGFGPHDYFNGKMCDLRVYDRALSKAEVQALSKRP